MSVFNDLARHRSHAFPGHVSGTARRQPGGQGAGLRAVGAGGARHPGLRHRQASQRRRHPGRRRPRHGAARRRAGGGDRCRGCRAEPSRRPAKAADEPAGSAIDPVAGGGTRRRAGPPDRLRPVRGHRPAGDRGAGPRGGLDRRLRAVRRRNRRDGADRRLRAAFAGGDGQTGLRRGRKLLRRTTGIPPIYPPAGVRGPDHPGNPHFRRPCQGRGLAPGRIRGPDPGAAAGSVGDKVRARPGQKARQTGDKRVPLPYTGAKSAHMAG